MLHNLLPGSEEFTEEPYAGEDANIHKVYKAENGYVIETVTAGYADDIRMLYQEDPKVAIDSLNGIIRESMKNYDSPDAVVRLLSVPSSEL